jgi:preprotein translocase subunit SecF
VMGAVTLSEFALALLIGMISGVYSSIFIATPLLGYLKIRSMPPSRRKRLAGDELRAAVMGAGVSGRIPEDSPHGDGGETPGGDRPLEPVAAGGPSATAPAQADRLLSHPPRPRKKKRR